MSALIFLPLSGLIALIASLIVRWLSNRPDPGDSIPVSPEDLAREKPSVAVVNISYEYLEPLLERIENATDWGFNSTQRTSLIARVGKLHPGAVTSAMFPVRYSGESVDILMHFGRLDPHTVRCRFESSAALVTRIQGFLAEIPKRAPA